MGLLFRTVSETKTFQIRVKLEFFIFIKCKFDHISQLKTNQLLSQHIFSILVMTFH